MSIRRSSQWPHGSYYPGRRHPSHSRGSHTLLTKRSDSNLQEIRQQPPPPFLPREIRETRTWPWPDPRSQRVKLSTQARDTLSAEEGGEERGLCPGFITAAKLGSPARSPSSALSSVLSFIHYFNFTGSLPQPGLSEVRVSHCGHLFAFCDHFLRRCFLQCCNSELQCELFYPKFIIVCHVKREKQKLPVKSGSGAVGVYNSYEDVIKKTRHTVVSI